MNKELNIISWNITGVMSSASCLCDILTEGEIDICGISEHWLYPHNIHFLGSISSDFNYHAVCDSDLSTASNRKVGKGGAAILWHRSLDHRVVPISIDSDRIVGIQLELLPGQLIYIFQVYLPCSNHPIDKFRGCIDLLYDLYNSYCDNGVTVFMGDFNGVVHTCTQHISTRDRLLSNFLKDCNLCAVNTLPLCRGGNNTYVSYDDQFTSMIDYVCIPVECIDLVLHCEIADDSCLNMSRHRPILCCLEYSVDSTCNDSQESDTYINWKRCNADQIQNFESLLAYDREVQSWSERELNQQDIDDIYHGVCQISVNCKFGVSEEAIQNFS